ncbi:hypothetical protein MPER_11324 [Moniliophthora perniciosa FA553]|nr:hypothetical protein MPER_11324 [Moniliophthora perniciosa FA553]
MATTLLHKLSTHRTSLAQAIVLHNNNVILAMARPLLEVSSYHPVPMPHSILLVHPMARTRTKIPLLCVRCARSLARIGSWAQLKSGSGPGDGGVEEVELNQAFKFGGAPMSSPEPKKVEELTLSDIIPPPSHVRNLSDSSSLVDDSVLNSILAKATEVPQRQSVPRPRMNFDSSMKRSTRSNMQSVMQYRHSRHESGISFTGFDSFEEVRYRFEFHDYRPAFYPPPSTTFTRRGVHG